MILSCLIQLARPSNNLFAELFRLLNSMIGSGILNQPQVYADSGIASAVLMSILAAFLIWLGLILLIDTGVKFGKTNRST